MAHMTFMPAVITLLLLYSTVYGSGPVSVAYSAIDFPHDKAYINTESPTFVGSLYDAGQIPVINETVELFINGISLGSCLSDANGTFRLCPERTLVDGIYTITALCHESQIILGPHTVVIDTTAPSISIAYPTENGIVTASTFTTYGLTEENAMVETFLDNDTYGDVCYADDTGSWSIDYTTNDGIHTLTAQATDLAGNRGQPSQLCTFLVVTH